MVEEITELVFGDGEDPFAVMEDAPEGAVSRPDELGQETDDLTPVKVVEARWVEDDRPEDEVEDLGYERRPRLQVWMAPLNREIEGYMNTGCICWHYPLASAEVSQYGQFLKQSHELAFPGISDEGDFHANLKGQFLMVAKADIFRGEGEPPAQDTPEYEERLVKSGVLLPVQAVTEWDGWADYAKEHDIDTDADEKPKAKKGKSSKEDSFRQKVMEGFEARKLDMRPSGAIFKAGSRASLDKAAVLGTVREVLGDFIVSQVEENDDEWDEDDFHEVVALVNWTDASGKKKAKALLKERDLELKDGVVRPLA
jgi:hypothetical protein